MDSDTPPCARVAVIGSGLAGLTTAHLLSVVPSHVQVHVFEKSEELGMDNSSISIKSDKGSYRIDVPMRSINTGSHGRVKRLYDYLKVPLVKNDFSYSFSRLAATPSTPEPATALSTGTNTRSSTPLPPYSKEPASALRDRAAARSRTPPPPPFPAPATTLIYEGASGLRWPPVAVPSSLATDSSSLPALVRSTWRQSVYIVHLVFLAVAYLHLLALSFFYVKSGLTHTRKSLRVPFVGKFENVAKEPLDEWCRKHGVLEAMREEVLVPLMAAVCTVGVDEARGMPVGEALEYITSTFISAHYTTAPSFGVRGIVRRLIAPVQVSNIYLSSHIHEIVYNPSLDQRAYTLRYRLGSDAAEGGRDSPGEELEVDYIIFATQANQAAALLETLSASDPPHASPPRPRTVLDDTIAALNSFHYVTTLVVNHTDQSFLPPDPSDRRDLNLAAFPPRPRPRNRDRRRRLSESSDARGEQAEEEPGVWTTHLPSSSVETTHVVSSHPSLVSSSSSPSSSHHVATRTTKPGPERSDVPLHLLQTTNPLRPVRPDAILSSSWFSRAFVTRESKAVLPLFLLGGDGRGVTDSGGRRGLQGHLLGARTTLSDENDGRGEVGRTGDGEGQREGEGRRAGGVYFTGSWCERGIPLLEGCVTSAENVVRDVLEREGVSMRPRDWPF
ncbi:hypothetical protein JCM11491_006058 [Sporobolomyces phaffii]